MPQQRKKQTVPSIQVKKVQGNPIVMLTAYDATQANLVQEAGIDIILVGDSLGMTVLGLDSTIPVTIDDMVHHAKAVRRGAPDTMVIVDMPFLTYHQGTETTVRLAGRLMQESHADAVKLEGGAFITPHIEALIQAGIPVCGHLGLTPQAVLHLGGYKVQGKDVASADRLMADALAVERAGAFAVVLECIPSVLAKRVTETLAIPTIGIGAGDACDGQVLVFHDVLGLTQGSRPKFVKQYAALGQMAIDALATYRDEVVFRHFPDFDHQYDIPIKEPRKE